jgi:hypothetical protein
LSSLVEDNVVLIFRARISYQGKLVRTLEETNMDDLEDEILMYAMTYHKGYELEVKVYSVEEILIKSQVVLTK